MSSALFENQDLVLLQSSVSKWLDSLPVEDIVRRRVDGSASLLDGLVSLGAFAVAVDENCGGAGLGLPGVAVITQELGRRGLQAPVISQGLLAVDLLSACDTPDAHTWLSKIAEGQCHLAVAPFDGAPHLQLATNGTITAQWRYVADTRHADHLLMVTPGPDPALRVLPVSALTITPLDMVDGSDFAHVAVEQAQALSLGSLADGDTLARIMDRTRLALAWEMIGLAETGLSTTCEYLRVREQFGRKIGSYQALQHRLAKAYISIELASASAESALMAGDAQAFSVAATTANTMAAEALHAMSNETVQLHGGIGMTDEHLTGHYLKRARVLETVYGGRAPLAARFAELNGY
ncbi:acyl-CoA dehydrogenase family protein [Spongiibacter taiwanensis]|uniref:acyl-CoA dehydrogenase family protein n=1 Tax=Spongiibacter taiwanensis TaxID=1748242 RepID=UPI002035D0A9|nr:acyl-CoA dehydrogenase family protein [Spongiibacter taiwanensis]USA42775.1 acyl-CoA dehydrogenase family protein [Spongiibacter taiwanensis]